MSEKEGSAEHIIEQAGQNKLSDVIKTWWYSPQCSKPAEEWNEWTISMLSNMLVEIVWAWCSYQAGWLY